MQKLLFYSLALLCGSFLARAANPPTEKDSLTFKGIIENRNSDSIVLIYSYPDVEHTLYLDNDNRFNETILIAHGFYWLGDKKEQTQIYLKPGKTLQLTVDASKFDETLSFEGDLASENNYLAAKYLKKEKAQMLNYYGYYGKLKEPAFLKLSDSLYQSNLNFLKNYKEELSSEFYEIERKSINYKHLTKLNDYQSVYRFVTGEKEFAVSANYPNSFAEVNTQNEELLIVPGYTKYIEAFLRKITRNNLKEKEGDFDLEYLSVVEQKIENDKIKEELAFEVGKWRLKRSKNPEKVYEQIQKLIKESWKKEKIEQVYVKLKKAEKGSMSAGFNMKDLNNQPVSLKSLRGKLVYIDIWATWCLPCIKEIPDLQKVQQHFKGKNITFVSIAKDDDKERWKKMIKDKSLKGVQLFSTAENKDFFEFYSVSGIPRFILLDEKGHIIDSNAKRPSNAELVTEIETLLRK